MNSRVYKFFSLGLLGCLLSITSGLANATLLGLTPFDPDINATQLAVLNYDAGSGQLVIDTPTALAYTRPTGGSPVAVRQAKAAVGKSDRRWRKDSGVAYCCTRKNCCASVGCRVSGDSPVTSVNGPVTASAFCRVPFSQVITMPSAVFSIASVGSAIGGTART